MAKPVLAHYPPILPETAFYTLLSLVSVVGSGLFQTPPLQIALYFFFGIFLWTLIEYLFHRFIFHELINRTRSRSKAVTLWYNHTLHHHDPQNLDHVITHVPYSIPIVLGIFSLLFLITGNFGVTLSILPGILAGYLYYEWVHFKVHFRPGKNKLCQWQLRNHLQHHFETPEKRFGVTNPFWDILFRTR